MSIVTPTLRKPNKPTLATLLDTFAHALLKNLNCVKVGEIQDYSAGGANQVPTATVLIAQQQVTSISSTGVKTLAEYPLLVSVPVYFMGGGGLTFTFPVKAGDECLVLFNDRNIESWVASGAGQPPNTSRLHDLSDGICLVGLRSDPRALVGISTTAAQLRSDDGNTYFEVHSTGGQVNAVAPGGMTFTTPTFTVIGDMIITETIAVENTAASPTASTVNGGFTVTGGDIVADGISLKTHRHTGVTAGSADTGGPI